MPTFGKVIIHTCVPQAVIRRRLAGGASAWLSVLALGAACGPSDREIDTFVRSWETSVSAADYQVQPPDALEISSAQAKEIDGEIQTVRQDGKITLRLLGDVKVAGMTPIEISRKLESLLRRYYIEPQVNVRLKEANSKQYYVFGQVDREGPFPCTGRDTLLSALALAQPTFIALKSRIKVIRPNHDLEKRHVMTVDAERIIKKGKLEDNVFLQEGDIIYVPPTALGWLGLKLNALFYPVQQTPIYGYAPAQVANAAND